MTSPNLLRPETGDPGNITGGWNPWTGQPEYQADPGEANADLRFPLSVPVYERMARTDSQTGAVLASVQLPLLRAQWDLNTDGVRPEVVDRVRTDLGLPAPGEQVPRRRASTIVWAEHLRAAMKAQVQGFSVFEQVYTVTIDDTGPQVHLRKLAPRLPSTIDRILVAPDGGLEGVVQKPPVWAWNRPTARAAWQGILIPADRLVVYSRQREGGDWYGTPLLRTAYKDWLVKDQLTRVNAQRIERNGMGVPVVTMGQDASAEDERKAETLIAGFRAGAEAGAKLPAGWQLSLVSASDSVDPIPSIKYHDEAIGRSVLAMFLNLGHDNGARSLGETFVDTFQQSLQAEADWLAATATDHVVRDLVAAQWGPDEPYPIITPGNLADQQVLTVPDLVALIGAGAVTPDGELEAWLRRRGALPQQTPVAVRQAAASRKPAQLAQPAALSANDAGDADDDAGVVEYTRSLLDRLRNLAGRHP